TVFDQAHPDIEIGFLHQLRYFPRTTRTDRAAIDIDDGRDFGARAAKEGLRRGMEFAAIHFALPHLDTQFSQQGDHRVPRDAFENVVGDGGGNGNTVTDDEEAHALPFRDLPTTV